MQYSKVEICGVDTSKLRVLKEKEKLELLRNAGRWISLRAKTDKRQFAPCVKCDTAFYKPRRKP